MKLNPKALIAKLPLPFWASFYLFLIILTIPVLAYIGTLSKADPGTPTVLAYLLILALVLIQTSIVYLQALVFLRVTLILALPLLTVLAYLLILALALSG